MKNGICYKNYNLRDEAELGIENSMINDDNLHLLLRIIRYWMYYWY